MSTIVSVCPSLQLSHKALEFLDVKQYEGRRNDKSDSRVEPNFCVLTENPPLGVWVLLLIIYRIYVPTHKNLICLFFSTNTISWYLIFHFHQSRSSLSSLTFTPCAFCTRFSDSGLVALSASRCCRFSSSCLLASASKCLVI